MGSGREGDVFTRVYDSIHGGGWVGGIISCPGPPRWGVERGYILSRSCQGMALHLCRSCLWEGSPILILPRGRGGKSMIR